jgi:hypothetical protein
MTAIEEVAKGSLPRSTIARTVTKHGFVVEFDTIEGSADEVWIGFTEDSCATVLDATGQPVRRNAHSVNRALWARENGMGAKPQAPRECRSEGRWRHRDLKR